MIYCLHQSKTTNLNKDLLEIRNKVIIDNSIYYTDSIHEKNYTRKLLYLINKINQKNLSINRNCCFEEGFYIIFKYILKRGANYLKHDHLHLFNKMVKSSDKKFTFFSQFKNFLENSNQNTSI